MLKSISYALISFLLGILFMMLTQFKTCRKKEQLKADTVNMIQIVPREVFITDTIRVKSVAWKTKDSLIFVESEIPCNDTSFIAQSDSIIVPTGDTINLAFNYMNRKGSFSLVYKPRPDSIVFREIIKPVKSEEPFPYGHILGAIGLGILLGAYTTSTSR